MNGCCIFLTGIRRSELMHGMLIDKEIIHLELSAEFDNIL